ncbi:hypothetical protein AGOR_G00058060 [Albula goreensis]|uniref:Ig-like domain-containing protein n=1 Tax=Albula goreensis TaxID=1534307 RepID=A0A8T3DXU4_9TELE|nr:hypothetical protein AGOR_G00058060 [Albula goreensis]
MTVFLPFYRRQTEMKAKHVPWLLLALLSVSLSHEFTVDQPKVMEINADGSVTIACTYSGVVESTQINGELKRKHANTVACQASANKASYQFNHNQTACAWRREPWNKFLFTLFNVKPNDQEEYVCKFSRLVPLPVWESEGKGTRLIKVPIATAPAVPTAPTPKVSLQCVDLGLLNWALIGLSSFLLLCCSLVTCAYIRLKVRQSKDLEDSLTYVPMQPPQSQTGNTRRGDPESNTTYMDMRKKQFAARASGRDMNYNSHLMNY